METGLRGKAVIVTGGASNIGKGIVLAFAREGSKIAIVDIDEAQSNRVADKAKQLGAEATLVIKADVTRTDEVESMVRTVLEKFGRVDALVNNVGWPADTTLMNETEEIQEKEIALNLRSTINCTKAVLSHMIRISNGTVVNIGSEAGRAGDPQRVVYSACKGGVIALTKAIARDVGRYGITVNCVCPHCIIPEDPENDTGEGSMFHPTKGQHGHTVMALLQSPEAQRAATSGHALSRLGKPADIGAAVVFLSSEAASFITGQTLSVNGGDSMT